MHTYMACTSTTTYEFLKLEKLSYLEGFYEFSCPFSEGEESRSPSHFVSMCSSSPYAFLPSPALAESPLPPLFTSLTRARREPAPLLLPRRHQAMAPARARVRVARELLAQPVLLVLRLSMLRSSVEVYSHPGRSGATCRSVASADPALSGSPPAPPSRASVPSARRRRRAASATASSS